VTEEFTPTPSHPAGHGHPVLVPMWFQCIRWNERLLLQDVPNAAEAAEKLFLQALDWARRQGALSWELRSTTSLARLWHQRHRTGQARKQLAAVYRRFKEGFTTADLMAAKVLLDALR